MRQSVASGRCSALCSPAAPPCLSALALLSSSFPSFPILGTLCILIALSGGSLASDGQNQAECTERERVEGARHLRFFRGALRLTVWLIGPLSQLQVLRSAVRTARKRSNGLWEHHFGHSNRPLVSLRRRPAHTAILRVCRPPRGRGLAARGGKGAAPAEICDV